jgi:hypothetical protein
LAFVKPPPLVKKSPGGADGLNIAGVGGAKAAVAKAMIPGMPPLPPFIHAPTLPPQLGLIGMIITSISWAAIPIVGPIAMATHMGLAAAVPKAVMPSGLLNPGSIPAVVSLGKAMGAIGALPAIMKKGKEVDNPEEKKIVDAIKALGPPGKPKSDAPPLEEKKCCWKANKKSGLCIIAKCKKRKGKKKQCLKKIFKDAKGKDCCEIKDDCGGGGGGGGGDGSSPKPPPAPSPPGVPPPPSPFLDKKLHTKCQCLSGLQRANIKLNKAAAEASQAKNSMRFAEAFAHAKLQQCTTCNKHRTGWTNARLLPHEYDAQKIWNQTNGKVLHNLASALYNYGSFIRRLAPKGTGLPCQPFRIINFETREAAFAATDYFKKNPTCSDPKLCGKEQTIRAIGPPANEDVKRASCMGDKTNTRRNQLKGPLAQRPLQVCDLIQIGSNPWAVYRVLEIDAETKSFRIDRPYTGIYLVEGLSITLVKRTPAENALTKLAEKKVACNHDKMCIEIVERQEETISILLAGKRVLQSSMKAAFNSAIGKYSNEMGHPPVDCNAFDQMYANKHKGKKRPIETPTWKRNFRSQEEKEDEEGDDMNEEDKESQQSNEDKDDASGGGSGESFVPGGKKYKEVISGSKNINSEMPENVKEFEHVPVNDNIHQDLEERTGGVANRIHT